MREANTTNKVFLFFTLLFIVIAAFSFIVFQKSEEVCTAVNKCRVVTPSVNNGDMIWDDFSRRLISFVSIK